MSRLIVISPHLDDAMFSCGSLIAATALVCPVLVVTVCAGIPGEDVLTNLDRAAGFSSSAEAVRERRREDIAACALLGASTLHLPVLDGQYIDEAEPHEKTIRRSVYRVTGFEGTFVAPIGVRHADHVSVADACRARADVLYEELPYRVLWPDRVPALGPVALELPACQAKLAAIIEYRSQLGGTEFGDELRADERYYRNPR